MVEAVNKRIQIPMFAFVHQILLVINVKHLSWVRICFLFFYKDKQLSLSDFFKAITTCDSNPCGAHGTCAQVILQSGQLTILCRCEPEWTGTYCDVNQTGSTVTATVITMTTTTGIFSNTSTSTTGPSKRNLCVIYLCIKFIF